MLSITWKAQTAEVDNCFLNLSQEEFATRKTPLTRHLNQSAKEIMRCKPIMLILLKAMVLQYVRDVIDNFKGDTCKVRM